MALGPIASADVEPRGVEDHGAALLRRDLTAAAGGDAPNVSVVVEELGSGGFDGPARYRLFGEEHLFVLSGRPTLTLGGQAHELRPGDHAAFPAGRKAAHALSNGSGEPCRYVVIGENLPHEVTVFPELGKAAVGALGPQALVDYHDDASDEPLPPRSSEALDWDDEPGAGTRFGGRSKHLSFAALGWAYRIGLLLESPAPGRRLAPRHYHLTEEEHALILEGEVALLLGDDERRDFTPGDYVRFPAGEPVAHSFLNAGDGPCTYLMIGERRRFDSCVYPDSNKIAIRGLGGDDPVFDMSARRRYWDGEDVG